MKNELSILLFFLLMLFALNNYSKSIDSKQPAYRGTIELPGKVKCGFDSLLIKYKEPYRATNTGHEVIYLITDKNGAFDFTLPRYTRPSKLVISVRHKGRWLELSHDGYFFEPNDDIFIKIIKKETGDSVRFDGKGAEKYNVVYALDKLKDELRNQIMTLNFEAAGLADKLMRFAKITEELAAKKTLYIKQSGMNDKMQKLVSFENGQIYSDWASCIYFYYSNFYKLDVQKRSLLKDYFLQFNSKFSLKYDSLISLCPLYLTRLSKRESYHLLFNGSSDSISLELSYKNLKSKYKGIVRERLVADMFTVAGGFLAETQSNPAQFDSLMRDGEKLLTIPFVKRFYSEKLRLAKGKALFNSYFYELKGDSINTASFKGKVVLIDMWNVGCSWCAIFHKSFHENVFPVFKNNPDFVYLSIGADRTKERWQEGINSGKYTNKEYLNVNMGTLGLNHPFAKHYAIQGLPFMLLIDRKGLIYSNQVDGTAETITMINNALKGKR